ncbi:hypothetical protein A3A39_03010 [Candidatus Kaiserbacteria bacterium RIFCSPLOWO2_01_FULL_54_13]|uniref:UDP-glucose/GDP-mannose dehydrogenase dimerisation domain-containing protein n=1 Tax=Candidatus Kaiserbacteria bacterium RIFCSPLOWO2_01_FULL_54_13 TaxID=1798512 RepID=A0A1F6F2E2_9BACT|nr:MAG: hypothetical protein A3A39_03010 [Candidatus Kaiserbacteria bacterium RIFCSPLOWO2_01_FULL_54_13]
MREKMVIVGFGWVGQANALALKTLGYDVAYYDPGAPPRHYEEHTEVYGSLVKLANVRDWDSESTWYVVCVGDRVSEEGEQDISNIQKALDSLKGAKGGVILRSTVIPDLLEKLKFDYYLPEFLHEKKAVEECIEPYLLVIGSRPGARTEPSIFALWRPQARKVFEGTPREASFIKYFSNLWNALRIAFVNEFGDTVGRPSNKEEISKISKLIDFLFDGRGYQRYGRAFGGHCLPKDTRAFAAWYGKSVRGVSLIAAVYESNAKRQNTEREYPLLPEWFSEWPERHISGWHALSELWYAVKKHIARPTLLLKKRDRS